MDEKLLTAKTLFNNGEKKKAVGLLAELVMEEPENKEAWYDLALCLDDRVKQIYCLQRAVKLDPSYLDAQQKLDRLIMADKQPDQQQAIQTPVNVPSATPVEDKMNLFNRLFSFNGRLGRTTYWIVAIIWLICIRIYALLLNYMRFSAEYGITTNDAQAYLIIFMIIFLPLVIGWMHWAVVVKRWHDLDKSGWWMLITLIPIVGMIWQTIELGFKKGTVGPNRFGEKTY